MMSTRILDRERLARRMADETERFAAEHPRSHALHERAKASLLDGVPMNWMVRWAGPFPLFVEEASGARFTCVDGHGNVLMPCGRCRQLLYENGGPGLLLWTVSGVRTMDEVLPDAFGPDALDLS